MGYPPTPPGRWTKEQVLALLLIFVLVALLAVPA